MGYCFMTFEKIKNTNQMEGKWKHNYREIEVCNADPDKKDLNEELISLNGKTYEEAFNERMKELGYGDGKKIRKNAVYGFEVVTTFSREDADRMDFEKWKENNVAWLRQSFNANPEKYGDNVLSVVYHADEPGNVHCHAFIIPIDEKGNLNSRFFVRSRQKLIELQDSYGTLMKSEHNLKRGLKNSKATHQDIKRYYASLNMALGNELPAIEEGENIIEYRERANQIYKDSSLKNLYLENKLKRMELEHPQILKNEISGVKKDFYQKYQKKAETLDELEREFGSAATIKEVCQMNTALVRGIAEQTETEKSSILNLIDQLVQIGRELYDKQKISKDER